MVTYSTIDHALGSPQGRNFGQGHRRSTYAFTPTDVTRGRVTGVCAIGHDGVWSAKDTGTVARHLSTIDAVSLAGLAIEAALRLEPVAVEALFVTDVSIRAGSSATEDLTTVNLEAQVAWNLATRVFDCVARVGTMKLTLTVAPVPGAPEVMAPEHTPAFFARHLAERIQHISDLDIRCDAGSMRARFGALAVGNGPPGRFSGLQSAHAELLSASEAIVCLAQLAQTMAYEFDQLSRDDSAVFWLRRLNVSLDAPRLRVGQLVDVDVHVVRTNELRVAGDSWRTLRLEACTDGLRALADVAHVLPNSAGA